MESSVFSPNSPESDLALVGRAKEQLNPPRGFAIAYDVLFSIACGGLVAGQALSSSIRPLVTIAFVLAMVGLATWWRRRLGWWLGGYSPRRARWVLIGMIVPLVALIVWVWIVPELWVVLTAGPAMAIIAFIASRFWAVVWRKELLSAREAS